MSNDRYTFQFAYDVSSTEGYSSAQLSARRGPDPQELLKSASLPNLCITSETPQMPPRGHKAHKNYLQSHYDPARLLQAVLRLKQTVFHLQCHRIPRKGPNGTSDWCPPMTANIHPPNTVTSLSDISKWVYLYGLLPIQQAFHQTNPSMQNYEWLSTDNKDERDLDRKLIRTYHWNTMDKHEVNGAMETPAPAMILFVQEPWVLSDKDFTNFIRTKSMPQVPRQLTGKERLWAKIYDECVKSKLPLVCRHDNITNGPLVSSRKDSKQRSSPLKFPASSLTSHISPRFKPSTSGWHQAWALPGAFLPARMMESQRCPTVIHRTHQYRRHNRNGNGEWQPVPVFQHSESEASSDSDSEDNKSIHSRFSHQRPAESELSYQSSTSNASPITQEFLRNIYAPDQSANPPPKVPIIAGDQLTKEAILPRRHWRSDEKAERLEMARAQLKENRARNDMLDWLDEGEWNRWEDGGSYGAPVPAAATAASHTSSAGVDGITSAMKKTKLREHWVNSTGEPPSPAFSTASRDGSAVGGKRGVAVGQAMFTVAPKNARRHFAYQA